ncbi:MAG: L-threonylcarbamoyladenylate synthase [Alphaproteobacteria bacterium]|nr:L-threonylcarbamoyladenylate synthase [Alphaproteobacteria bacterium]
MKNIHAATARNIGRAAEVIQAGGLVAFPTETVYGLGASVYNPAAVARIFKVKGRPAFNPLISHIADVDFLPEYAQADARATALARRFMPGPLTLVLNRTDDNPAVDLACAGLRTISVRMPDHRVALELIRRAGVPVVAPSANVSTTISPTTARHVFDSLGENVDMILDGGACPVGLESTIIDLTGPQVVLLRSGFITREELEAFLNEKVVPSSGNPSAPKSPGQMLRHYATRKPLRMNAERAAADEFHIGFGAIAGDLNLSASGDLAEAAAHLFDYLRRADAQSRHPKIAVAPIPGEGLGAAINDRLTRASCK